MPIVIVNPNCPPTPIDDFPVGCKRSREGSVLVRPLSTLTLTDDELAHIRANHSDCYRHFTVPDVAAQKAAAGAATRRAAAVKQARPAPKKPSNIARLAELVRSRRVELGSLDSETRTLVEKVLQPPAADEKAPSVAPAAEAEAPSRRRSGRNDPSE